MIDLSVSFSWEIDKWGFGATIVPIEAEDLVGRCLGLRLLCFGIDLMVVSSDHRD